MRTSLLAEGRNTLLNLRAAADKRARATNEISSGLRVTRPSDSPADAAGVVRSRASLATVRQFESNLGALRAELRAIDGSMFDAVDALQRGLTVATQAATGTQDARSRQLLGQEVEGLRRHLVTLANTVFDGRYVFAGTADAQAPFTLNPSASGGVVYNGDSRSRAVTFPDGRPAQISLPGDSIFLTPDEFVGAGRTPALLGAPPNPPIGVGVSFAGDISGVISVDLAGFFVAAAGPAGAVAGDTVSVNFLSSDGAISESITTVPLAGGEDAATIAGLLNDQIALNANVAGRLTFSDEGGALKLTVSDTAGVGFSFTSTSSGAVTSGLEVGGAVGGYSAQEIATALNARVAQTPALSGAGIVFEARNGQVAVDGNVDFTLTAIDFARGTEFVSGLAGEHRVGGTNSANVFGVLDKLIADLASNNEAGIAAGVVDLQRAIDHVGGSLGFYGSTLRQVEITLANLDQLEIVNQERLSLHQDADLLASIANLKSATSAEEFALQVAARRQPTLLDVLA